MDVQNEILEDLAKETIEIEQEELEASPEPDADESNSIKEIDESDESEEPLEGEVIDYPIVDEPIEQAVVEPEFITQVFYEEIYNIPEDCVEVTPPSFYKAKWDGEKWIEAGNEPEKGPHQPSVDEKLTALERDNRMLRLQNETLSDQYQFLEDVITEMIVATLP